MAENRKNLNPSMIHRDSGVAQTGGFRGRVGLRRRILAVGLFGIGSGCGYVSNPAAADSNDEVGQEETAQSVGSDSETGTESDSEASTEDTSPGPEPEAPSMFELDLTAIKQFEFSWAPALGAQYYQLLESVDDQAPFVPVGDAMVGLATSLTVPLHARVNARYMLRACNDFGCTDSDTVDVAGTLVEAIGYFKASNTDADDQFGHSVALSGDGSTLVIGAHQESSNALGIGGSQADDSAPYSGAVYVFVRDGTNVWTQQAYVKASNADAGDYFGYSVALSGDGSTLAVGAYSEASNAMGIDGNQADNSVIQAGAVYVFERDGMDVWTQQAYVKASNPGENDLFGLSVALSGDSNTLAVGASLEDSGAIGIDGDQADDSATYAGAVYVYVRDGMNVWTQQAYVKASNPDAGDEFGWSVALSEDGSTLAVGACGEDSNAMGINGFQLDNFVAEAGAVYVFERDGMNVWTQRAYVKASNPGENDLFGYDVALSKDGSTLAVGARDEDSNAMGIDGDQTDNSAMEAGAVYVYARDGMHVWTQQAYVKAPTPGENDSFGSSVALSGDGSTLAIGAPIEASNAVGMDGDQTNDSAFAAGAVYMYERDGLNVWTQGAYVKASNADAVDQFGWSVALSEDGTLAVGAPGEASNAIGISGNHADNSAFDAGAVYLY